MTSDPSWRFKMGSQDQNRSLRIRRKEGLRRLYLLGNPCSYSFRSDHILLCIIRRWRYSFTHSRRIRAIRRRIRKKTNHKVNHKSIFFRGMHVSLFQFKTQYESLYLRLHSLIFGSLPGYKLVRFCTSKEPVP